MATLTVTTTSRTGSNLGSVAVAAGVAGDDWLNTGEQLLYVQAGSTPATVTLTLVATLDGQTATSKTVVVGANERWVIGPFPTWCYNNATTGKASIAYSAVTDIKVLVFKVGT